MHKWFIFKNRGRGSIWSTSCFLPCPQTRAVKTFLWNLWQADMQGLSVTGAQRTQVQIFPCLNSCAVSEDEVALMWTGCVGNSAAFAPCWAETIPCKGKPVWSDGSLVSWLSFVQRLLRSDSNQFNLVNLPGSSQCCHCVQDLSGNFCSPEHLVL